MSDRKQLNVEIFEDQEVINSKQAALNLYNIMLTKLMQIFIVLLQ